jgi:hypothetical protein
VHRVGVRAQPALLAVAEPVAVGVERRVAGRVDPVRRAVPVGVRRHQRAAAQLDEIGNGVLVRILAVRVGADDHLAEVRDVVVVGVGIERIRAEVALAIVVEPVVVAVAIVRIGAHDVAFELVREPVAVGVRRPGVGPVLACHLTSSGRRGNYSAPLGGAANYRCRHRWHSAQRP